MTFRYDSQVRVSCNECGYSGTPWALELHSCDIQQQGGRCEDFPACGHLDGDGCQTLPEHTGDYWRQVMTSGESRHMYEPGSPEWWDAAEMDERYSGGDDAPWYDSPEACKAAGVHGDSGSGTDREDVYTCDACGEEYASPDAEDAYSDA